MSYKFKEIWCNKGNFTEDNRKSSEIDTLVIHYTGNNGDTAENNGNYFKNNVVETSAHYFVDDTTVVRSVADKILLGTQVTGILIVAQSALRLQAQQVSAREKRLRM